MNKNKKLIGQSANVSTSIGAKLVVQIHKPASSAMALLSDVVAGGAGVMVAQHKLVITTGAAFSQSGDLLCTEASFASAEARSENGDLTATLGKMLA